MTVTAGVKCFNNVRYIREALESAFRQTFRPLEIVVCDDCSSDGSWEAILETVEAHRGEAGVRVVVERNASNLGNLGNWERICELSTGDFIVKFDGDDASEPDRVSRIVAAVEAARGKGLSPALAGHGGWMVDAKGRPLGPMYPASRGNVVGAAMAFSRRCYTEFGRATCDPRIVMDDDVYAHRGMMLGDFVEMEDRLVRYRIGTGVSTSLWEVRRPMERCARYKLAAIDQWERDAAAYARAAGGGGRAAPSPPPPPVAGEREQVQARFDLIVGGSWRVRLSGARRLRTSTGAWRLLKFAFVLPRPLGTPLLFAYAAVRHLRRRLAGMRERRALDMV